MMRLPSATYSPDLEWWLRDSGAAFGEASWLGPSLDRIALYGRKPLKPRRHRTAVRPLPSEADSIDPRDYFVEGDAIEGAPPARMSKPGSEPSYTAVPRSLGHEAPAVFEPNYRDIQRARRVSIAWFKLTPEQQDRLYIAYMYQAHEGSEGEHRAYRLAVAAGAEAVLKALAGYFGPHTAPLTGIENIKATLYPALLEANHAA
jgi:hypothetical protein